jgi:hypothetical protein
LPLRPNLTKRLSLLKSGSLLAHTKASQGFRTLISKALLCGSKLTKKASLPQRRVTFRRAKLRHSLPTLQASGLLRRCKLTHSLRALEAKASTSKTILGGSKTLRFGRALSRHGRSTVALELSLRALKGTLTTSRFNIRQALT